MSDENEPKVVPILINPKYRSQFRIVLNGIALISINETGSLEYGEGYTPDAAAEVFWGCVAKNNPLRVRVARLESTLRLALANDVGWRAAAQAVLEVPVEAPIEGSDR